MMMHSNDDRSRHLLIAAIIVSSTLLSGVVFVSTVSLLRVDNYYQSRNVYIFAIGLALSGIAMLCVNWFALVAIVRNAFVGADDRVEFWLTAAAVTLALAIASSGAMALAGPIDWLVG